MKKKIIIILILACFSINLYAVSKAKVKLHTKINVTKGINSSSKEDLTINYEADIYRIGTTSNFNVNYNIAGWSLGLAMYNLQFIGPPVTDNNNFQIAPFLNIAKTFNINDIFSAQIGIQTGTVLINLHPRPFYIFEYGTINTKITNWSNIQTGVYHGNKDITYSVGTTGYIVGAQVDIIPKNLVFQGTYISGNSNVSGATINLLYTKYKHLQPYVGVGVPETNSGNEFYGIIGFNLILLN
jgi:hypothetical protein